MCNRRWISQAPMHRYCFFLMSRGFHDRAFHERSMSHSISDLSLRLLFDDSRSPSAWSSGAFCCGHVDEWEGKNQGL